MLTSSRPFSACVCLHAHVQTQVQTDTEVSSGTRTVTTGEIRPGQLFRPLFASPFLCQCKLRGSHVCWRQRDGRGQMSCRCPGGHGCTAGMRLPHSRGLSCGDAYGPGSLENNNDLFSVIRGLPLISLKGEEPGATAGAPAASSSTRDCVWVPCTQSNSPVHGRLTDMGGFP